MCSSPKMWPMRTESRSGQVLNNTSVSHKTERRSDGIPWSQNNQLFSIQAVRKHIAGHYQHGNLREQWTQRNSVQYDRRLNAPTGVRIDAERLQHRAQMLLNPLTSRVVPFDNRRACSVTYSQCLEMHRHLIRCSGQRKGFAFYDPKDALVPISTEDVDIAKARGSQAHQVRDLFPN